MKVIAEPLPTGGMKALRQIEARHGKHGTDRPDPALWIQDMIQIEARRRRRLGRRPEDYDRQLAALSR
jgi:hypothetical protein